MGYDFIIVMVMCASAKEAGKIGAHMLDKKLAACANVISGVASDFWWKGKIDSASEVLLTMKTTTVKFEKIEREVRRLHSYEVPEIIALPIVRGSKNYLNWIKESVK